MQPVGGGGGGGLPTLPPMMTGASSAASFSDVEYLDAHFKKYPRVGNEMMKASQQRFTAEQKTRKLEYELKCALSSKRSDVSSFESTSKALSSAMTKLKENKNEIFLYNRDLADVTRQFEELKEDYGTLQEVNNQLRLELQEVGREGMTILQGGGDGFNLGAGEGGDFPLHDDDDAMVVVTQERDAASALVDSLTVERDASSALVITLRQERNAAMNERNSAVLLADRISVERDTAHTTIASLVLNRDFIQATLTAAEGDHAAIVMQKEQMLRMAEAKIADLEHQMVVARGGAARGR
jgi:chromosome segregation ATPase